MPGTHDDHDSPTTTTTTPLNNDYDASLTNDYDASLNNDHDARRNDDYDGGRTGRRCVLPRTGRADGAEGADRYGGDCGRYGRSRRGTSPETVTA
jgi:hypothetical protein